MALDFSKFEELRNRMPKIDLKPPNDDADSLGEAAWSGIKAGTGNLASMNADIAALAQYPFGDYANIAEAMDDKGEVLRPLDEWGKGVQARNDKNYSRLTFNWLAHNALRQAPQVVEAALIAKAAAPVVTPLAGAGATAVAARMAPKLAPAIGQFARTAAPWTFADLAQQVPMEMTDKMKQELTDPDTGEYKTDPESRQKASEIGRNVGIIQAITAPITGALTGLAGGGGLTYNMGKAGLKEAAGLTGKEAFAAAQKAGARVAEEFAKRDAMEAAKAGFGSLVKNMGKESIEEVYDDYIVPPIAKGEMPVINKDNIDDVIDTAIIGGLASAPQGFMAHHLNKQAGRQYLAGLQAAENMHNITNAAEQAPTGNFDNKQPETPKVTPTDEVSARRAIVEAARADLGNEYGNNDCTTRVNSWYGAAGANQRNAWAPTSMQDAIENGNFYNDFKQLEDGDIVYWDNGSGEADHVGVWDEQAGKVIQSGSTEGVQYMDLNYMRPLGFSKPTFGSEIKVGSTTINRSDLDMTVNENDLGNQFYEIYKGITEQNEELGKETTYADYLEAITNVADPETAAKAAEVLNMGDENAIADMANALGYEQNAEMYENKGLSPKIKKAFDTTGEVNFQNKALADTFMAQHPTYQRLNDTTVAAPASYKRPDATAQNAPTNENTAETVKNETPATSDVPVAQGTVPDNSVPLADEAQAEEDLQSLLNDVPQKETAPQTETAIPPMVNAVPGAQSADDVINQITQNGSAQNPPINMQNPSADMQNGEKLAENQPILPESAPIVPQNQGNIPQMAGNGTPVPSSEVLPSAKGNTSGEEKTPLKTANSAESVMDEIVQNNHPTENATKEEIDSVISDIQGMEKAKSEETAPETENKSAGPKEETSPSEATAEETSEVEQKNESESQKETTQSDKVDKSEDLSDEKKIENFIEEMLKKSSNKRVSKSAKLAAKVATKLLNSVAKTYSLNGVTGYVDGLIKRLTVIPNSEVNNIKGGTVRRQNAGENAITAPKEELAAAELMEQMGKSPQEIFRETGWFRNDDGKWRFYIPDNLDGIDLKKFKRLTSRKPSSDEHKQTTLDKIYDNPALFAAYPFLRDVKITQNDKVEGYGQTTPGLIEINFNFTEDNGIPASEGEHKRTIVHEIQHMIQNHEGFAKGYSADDRETAAKVLKKSVSSVTQDEIDDLYRRAAGEREASMAERLAGWERIKTPETEKSVNRLIEQGLLARHEDSLLIFGDMPVADATQLYQDARGATVLSTEGEQASYAVHLMETADESTFIHEVVHILKEELRRAAEAFPKSQAKKDYEAFEKWCNYAEGQLSEYEGTATEKEFTERNKAIQDAIEKGDTELADALKEEWADERLARGFEQYLQDGTAPNKTIANIFEKFKNWLNDIYSKFTGIGAKPSEEVKAVFDRMMGVKSGKVTKNSTNKPEKMPKTAEIPTEKAETIPKKSENTQKMGMEQLSDRDFARQKAKTAAETTEADRELFNLLGKETPKAVKTETEQTSNEGNDFSGDELANVFGNADVDSDIKFSADVEDTEKFNSDTYAKGVGVGGKVLMGLAGEGKANFAEWSKAMIDRFGNNVKSWLGSIYETIRSLVKNKTPYDPKVIAAMSKFTLAHYGEGSDTIEKLYSDLVKLAGEDLAKQYRPTLEAAYAGLQRWESDVIEARHEKQRAAQTNQQETSEQSVAEDTGLENVNKNIDRLVEENFDDNADPDVVQAFRDILSADPENPAKFFNELVKENKSNIKEELKDKVDFLKSGMGNGVDLVDLGDGSGRMGRVSNNAPWYQKWYKDYGRKPTVGELEDIATAAILGESNSYVPDELVPRTNAQYEDIVNSEEAESLRSLLDERKTLEALQDIIPNIKKGELLETPPAVDVKSKENIGGNADVHGNGRANSTRNSEGNNQDSVGKDNGNGRPAGGNGRNLQSDREGNEQSGSDSVRNGSTDTGRKTGNSGVQSEVSGRDRDGSTRNTELSSSVRDSLSGVENLEDGRQAEDIRPSEDGRLNEAPISDSLSKLTSDIHKDMPFLHAAQAETVAWAENRLFNENEWGALCSDGTGTGKTFEGLGVVKRMVEQGKSNILIVTPSQSICKAWIDAGTNKSFFGLNISALENTKTAGKGIVTTTYANLATNNDLVNRDWDMVIVDESHKLMSGGDGNKPANLERLRALTYHPSGFFERSRLLHYDDYKRSAEIATMLEGEPSRAAGYYDKKEAEALVKAGKNLTNEERGNLRKESEELQKKLYKFRADEFAKWSDIEKKDRPKVFMLSATAFSYENNIAYGNGYLFDYPTVDSSGAWIDPNMGYNQFMMDHLGYRWRYGRLEKPPQGVDRTLLQQRFNSWLRSTGAMKGRLLDVPVDYDQGFLVTNSAVGKKIDDAVDMLNHDDRFAELAGLMLNSKRFGSNNQRYLLEYMNAKEAVNIAKEYVAKGYKVVVMHKSRKDQEPVNPFNLENMDWASLASTIGKDATARVQAQYQTFKKEHPDLVDDTALGMDDLAPTVETFREAFGNRFRAFNGKDSKKGVIEAFNAHDRVEEKYDKKGKVINVDKLDADIISVQMDAGGAGISLHDIAGDKPRVTLYVAAPTKPSDLTQTMGRTLRDGTKSNVIFRFITTGTRMEDRLWTNVVATRATEEENLSQGESAQVFNEMLKMKYAETYTGEWEKYKPGSKGEGTGGRAEAKMLSDKISGLRNDPFNVAKTEYEAWHNGKKKLAMGKDYFPTPEPLGLMMTKWAGIQEGDKVLEPSAGHGAISRWFPNNAVRKIIEPYHNLMVQAQMNSDIDESGAILGDFMNHHISNKYDEIVMNPPFGKAASEAIPHFNKAIKHLRDSGRLVAILPNSPKMIEAIDKTVNEEGNVFVREVIKLPECTFKGSGTKVGTLLYIVDKQDSAIGKGEMSRSMTTMRDLTDITDVNDLFDTIKDMKAPERYRHNYVTPEMKEHAMATYTSAYQKIVAACPTVAGGGIKMFNRLVRLMPNGDIQFVGSVSVTSKLIEQMNSIGAKYDENLKGFYFDNAVDAIKGMREAIQSDRMANLDSSKYPTPTANDWVAKVNMSPADKKVDALKEMQKEIARKQTREVDMSRPPAVNNANAVLDTEVVNSARVGVSGNSFVFTTDFPEALTDALNDHGLVIDRITENSGSFRVLATANSNATRSELLNETLSRGLSDMEIAYDNLRNRTNEPVNKTRKDIGRIVTSAMAERGSEPTIRFLDGNASAWASSNGVVTIHANDKNMQAAEEAIIKAGAKPVVDTDGNQRLPGSKTYTFNSVKKFLDFWNETAMGNNVLHSLEELPDRAAASELLAEERAKRIEEEADLPKPPEPTPVKHNGKQATAEMHTDTRDGSLTPKMSIPNLDKNEYKVVSGIVKEHGGYWSRFAKGFLFSNESERDAALNEVNLMLDGGVDEMRFSADNEDEHNGFISQVKESEIKPADYGFVQNILSGFAKQLGHEIKFFRGKSNIRGAWDGDTFYLNANANVPIHYVFFHEFTHWMRDQHPVLFSQIAATFQARNGISREAVETYRKRVKFSRLATNEAIVEEIIADAMMHSKVRKDLFNQMLKTNLKPWAYVLARMYYAVQDNFMHPLKNAPKGFDMSQINKLNVELSGLLARATDAEGNKLFKVDPKGRVLLDYHTGETIKPADLEMGIESPIDDLRYSGDNESGFYKGVVEKNPYTLICDALFKDTDPNHLNEGFGMSDYDRNSIAARVSAEIGASLKKWGDLTEPGSHADIRDHLKSLKKHYIEFSREVGYLRSKGEPLNSPTARRLATQIMYGWRCFDNDSRISDERIVETVERGQSVEGRNVETGSSSLSALQQGRTGGNGRRNVVGRISAFRTGRRSVLEAFGLVVDEYDAKYYRKPKPKAPEVEIKYSADNPGYTNNKDTHKSQDMRQINRWAIERLCDQLGINITPFLVKSGLKAAGGNIVERMPLTDEQRKPQDRRDIGVLQNIFRSPRKLKEIFPKLAPIIDSGLRAVTQNEKMRYGYTEGMNEVEKLLGYNKWKKNDKFYEDRKHALKNILGAGDAYVMNFTEDELTSGILSVKHIDQLKREGKSSDEIGEIRDALSEIKTEDKRIIKAYNIIRKLSDYAYKTTNDTKMGVHTLTKNMTASKLEELRAMERAKGGQFIKILSVNSLDRHHGQEEMYTVTYRQPRLDYRTVDNATPDEVELWRNDPRMYVVSAEQTNEPGKIKCTYCTAPEPLKYHAGHVPHAFEGFLIAREWGEDVGGHVETHYKVIGSADTLMGARKKALGISENNPNAKIVIVPKFFRYEQTTEHAAIMGDKDYEKAISKMAETMKIPVSEFAAMTKNAITTKNRGRFFGHLIDRKGAEGYDENYFRALRHYYNQAARYVALDDFKRSSINWYEREFGNYDLEPETPLAAYAKGYIADVNGEPVELEKKLNRAISQIPFLREIASTKVAGRPALYFANILTKIGTYSKLGAPNIASTLIQYTQLLNMQGALDSGLRKGTGYIGKGISMYKEALKDPNGEMANLLNKDLGLPYQIGAEVAGGYSNSEKQRGLFGGFRYAEVVNKLLGASMWPFRMADQNCRAVALLGAYQKAIDNGMTKPEAIKYAQDVCAEVNFDYSVADAPGMFRRLGPVGTVMFQFQKYPVKQLEYFKMIFDRGYKRGGTTEAMKEVTKYLSPYVILAGIGGVPLLGTLMTAVSFFMAHGDDDEWDWKEKLKKAVFTNFGNNPITRTALYGIGGAAPGGVDIGYRVGIGDFAAADMRAPQSVPESVSRSLGVTASSLYNAWVQWAHNGNVAEGIKAISPGIGNLLIAYNGEVRTTRGRVRYKYDSYWQRFLRGIGITPIEERVTTDLNRIEFKDRKAIRNAKYQAIDDFVDNPNPETLAVVKAMGVTPKQIQTEKQRKQMTTEEIKAGKPSKPRKPKTYMDSEYYK